MDVLARDSLRIVHVEDDHEFAQLCETLLKRAGFEQPIVRCKDGILALHYFSMIEPEYAPDVILLDLHMPQMNGLEVLHWLRHSHSEQDVAVYLLTSSDDPEDRRRAAADDVTEYLLKTPLFDELIQNLDHLIAVTNNQRLEEAAGKMRGTMGELALMGRHASEMVVLTDVEGLIEWVNEPFIRTSGYTLQEMRGKKPGRLLQGPESDHAAIKMLRHAVHSALPCECIITNYRKSGTPYPVHISLSPVFGKSGLEGFLAVERDLSEKEEKRATDDW